MSEKKQESFTVTDRRLFTSEGELRREVSEEEVSTSKPVPPAAAETKVTSIAAEPSALDQSAPGPSEIDPSVPPLPTAAEQREQADAYRDFDQRVLAAGKVMETEDTVLRDDGLHTYIAIKAPLRDEQGRPYAICGISTDITEWARVIDQFNPAEPL